MHVYLFTACMIAPELPHQALNGIISGTTLTPHAALIVSVCLALSRFNTAITTKTLNSRLGISHTVDFNSFPVYIDAKLMCVCKLNSWFVCLIHWTIDWQWLALRSPTDNDWATFLWTTLINVIEWGWNIRDIHMYKYSPVILMRSNAVHKST